jgi:glycyl-tRNA synthetase beta chain
MAEFFLELFSEEIPARMQEDAAERLYNICNGVCQGLAPKDFKVFYGPRRLAVSVNVAEQKPGQVRVERGPREGTPEIALTKFIEKFNATRAEIVTDNGYFWLNRSEAPIAAVDLISSTLSSALAYFSWPKSMRWGQGGYFTWVRPLRRIICLLDGEVLPITLGPVTASNETEGHRIHGPGPFAVSSAEVWEEKLFEHRVIADQTVRRQKIKDGMAEKAAALNLTVVPDEALLDEVTGLVEWPVPLIGSIDEKFMDLPWEVRELSMKTNQKYFALRDTAGNPAPYFAFVANLEASDGGAAIISGNERVLRARLSDARHFWDLDLKKSLYDFLPKLERITFHAKIGTQSQRAKGIEDLAGTIADLLGADGDEALQAKRAGLLCKADLVTGMVGEFPELQGIMGGYYAEQTFKGPAGPVVGQAIKTHYQPKGPSDAVPTGTVAIAVALADKLDTLTKFLEINEKPTGSGDPYALRRCALGVIRIILENGLRLHLKPLLNYDEALFDFIIERLRVKLRGEGKRFDVLDAVLAAGADDDLVRLMKRVEALGDMLGTEDGKNLHAAYKRAANILKIEDAKDGPHVGMPEGRLLREYEEHALSDKLRPVEKCVVDLLRVEDFETSMQEMASLRPAIDAFFQHVTVNDPTPEIRQNRLRLLARFRDTVNIIADFSKIEG